MGLCGGVVYCNVYGSPGTGGVGPPPGFTAQSPPGAIASSVKPGVCPTPGRPRTSEARGGASPVTLYCLFERLAYFFNESACFLCVIGIFVVRENTLNFEGE